jgi:hypothetical protein
MSALARSAGGTQPGLPTWIDLIWPPLTDKDVIVAPEASDELLGPRMPPHHPRANEISRLGLEGWCT